MNNAFGFQYLAFWASEDIWVKVSTGKRKCKTGGQVL